VRTALIRKGFLDVEDIKQNVMVELNAVRLEAEFSKLATNVIK
jgi:hypothetical protein